MTFIGSILSFMSNMSKTQNADLDTLFRGSVRHGDLERCKKLYSKGANIRSKNDDAFLYSLHDSNQEIAYWMCSIDPNYKCQFDETGYLMYWTIKDTRH